MTDNQAQETTEINPTRLHLGAAYYPEQWPEERWPKDIRLMQEAGFTVVRLAEFAWSTLEPCAGEFHFDWLERAIAMLAEANVKSVLGTPTAAPPAWLIQQHPNILPADETGRRGQLANNRPYCVNSPEFHAAAQRIATAMGKHFGPNQNVVGWQLDNHYHGVCFCDRCRKLFQEYLQERFGSLSALNEQWSTRYRSQTYSDWGQIPLPLGPANPGLKLAFKQFVTENYRRYQQLQLNALRPHLSPGVWVTHNFLPWADTFDHYTLNEDLDLASAMWYVGSGHYDFPASGAGLDLVRGFKQKNFWLMETQAGNVNWSSVNNSLNKGEGRAMAWHAVAHGAEAVLYWQWRSAPGGQEQYHGTLLDPSGRPRLFYQEVERLGREFAKVSGLLAGATSKDPVALLNHYPSRWSIQEQPHHQNFDYVAHLAHYYKPLARLNIPVDLISADVDDLSRYKVVIAPALIVLHQSQIETLSNYVKKGGRLVLTARTGMKDDNNALLPLRQPGLLAELAGVEVAEYFALDEPLPVKGNWFAGHAHYWAELLLPTASSAIHIARYGPGNGWLDDQPAITVRSQGTGLVYYVGAYLDEAAQYALLAQFVKTAGINGPPLKASEGVEIRALLNSEQKEVWLVINHHRAGKIVEPPWPVLEHLSGKTFEGKFKLVPYGVAILTRID
ncbi:MAG: beta-galactosidase [Anaerolineae bacterium]|nr:beta-galactosidase [Anaerolineae bacterium]